MGSGHFFVNATNRISNFITEFLNEYDFGNNNNSSPLTGEEELLRTAYMELILIHSVELAKLSLWILSMAKDAHLSFLNHHLKCGNSLVGARLSDIGTYPDIKKRRNQFR